MSATVDPQQGMFDREFEDGDRPVPYQDEPHRGSLRRVRDVAVAADDD